MLYYAKKVYTTVDKSNAKTNECAPESEIQEHPKY